MIDVCNSVAARITVPAFRDAIDWLLTFVPREQLAAVMCGSLAARLTEPEFRAAIDRLRVGLGVARMQIIMCDGVANRLLLPGYLDAVLALAERLDGWGAGDRLSGFLNRSPYVSDVPAIAMRLADMDAPEGLATVTRLLQGKYAARKRRREEFAH